MSTLSNPDRHYFNLPVVINNLEFAFKGSIPLENRQFSWSVYAPEWKRLMEPIDIESIPAQYRSEVLLFQRSRGRVGGLRVSPKNERRTSMKGLYLGYIWTGMNFMQEYNASNTEYDQSYGVGSFLLQNLLTYADTRGYFIELLANASGVTGLSQKNLVEWYLRHSFDFVGSATYEDPEMVRYAQASPNTSMPIYELAQQFL